MVTTKDQNQHNVMESAISCGQKDLSHALKHVAVQRQGLLSGDAQTAGSEVIPDVLQGIRHNEDLRKLRQQSPGAQ